jgi:hypothetical protein
MLHKYQIIAGSHLLLMEITWCIYSDQLSKPVLYTQFSAVFKLLYVVFVCVCMWSVHMSECVHKYLYTTEPAIKKWSWGIIYGNRC